MFLFSFFLLAWFGSAVSSSIYNMALKDSEPTHVAEQFRKRQTTTTIQFCKSFEMLHLCLKKNNIFSTISTMTHKFTWKWGRWSVLAETDRNQSKQSNFELSKVQFHWIAKYLCKIEIVENSIFVFQVLPPQDSKLLG